jgi:hypothetical protein
MDTIMKLNGFAVIILLSFFTNTIYAGAFEEVNEWRRRTGLPAFKMDKKMMEFARTKARFRALNDLRDSHTGPRNLPLPAGWCEGTGEATPEWGILTCCLEEDHIFIGAHVVVNSTTGLRYMVLVLRGGSCRALIPRNNIPTYNTSYLTPKPETVKGIKRTKQRCPRCGKYH